MATGVKIDITLTGKQKEIEYYKFSSVPYCILENHLW